MCPSRILAWLQLGHTQNVDVAAPRVPLFRIFRNRQFHTIGVKNDVLNSIYLSSGHNAVVAIMSYSGYDIEVCYFAILISFHFVVHYWAHP